MKQIHTREQLREEIYKIIDETLYIDYENTDRDEMENCKDRLVDLIADLPNLCFHSKNNV